MGFSLKLFIEMERNVITILLIKVNTTRKHKERKQTVWGGGQRNQHSTQLAYNVSSNFNLHTYIT
jgi:hypothetical protein